MVRCKAADCKKHASFGAVSGAAEFCKAHKLAGHVNVRDKKCIHPGCSKIPHYGDVSDGIVAYCATHKMSNHIDLKNKRCIHPNCSKQPHYGDVSDGIAAYCATHKLNNHINLKSKRCVHPNCSKQPVYGDVLDGIAIYCVTHKMSDHIDLKNKRCIHPNCSKQPYYGDVADGIAAYCVTHKMSNHINLRSKRCIHPGCSKQPYYGDVSDSIALYCTTHKMSDHINVISKRCVHPGCLKRPAYGNIADGIAAYCVTHKMSNHIDLKNKKCIHPDCKTRASFGMPGYPPEYCMRHKKPEMISKKQKVKAEKKTCDICCIDVHYSEMYCPSCKTYLADGKTVQRKQKELEIGLLLDENKIAYTHDIVVKDGCSKKRPDFVIATTWGTIILEVDEHQHNRKTYTCICELTRMRQLYFDVGVENLLFIRYNPDKYDTMCDDKPMAKKLRKEYLAKYLKERLSAPHEKLGVVYLFYDKFISSCVEIEAIDPYLSKMESSQR